MRGCGLRDMVWCWDSVISKIFSNMDDPVVLGNQSSLPVSSSVSNCTVAISLCRVGGCTAFSAPGAV